MTPPTQSAVDVSVVIPVHGALPHLNEQLDALSRQDTPLSFEVLLADNGASADLPSLLSKHPGLPGARCVDARSRPGAAHARNVGAREAAGELLLFCDADDVVDDFWVHEMHRARRPDSLLAGRLAYDRLNGVAERALREPVQSAEAPNFYGHHYVVSANMGILRSLFLALGGFDETFQGAAGEDVDLPLRAFKRGITVTFVPAAVVHYRLKPKLKGALAQAAAYGRAAPGLYERHSDIIPAVNIGDDLAAVSVAAASAVRAALTGRPDRRWLWSLRYHAAQARVLARTPEYWRLRANYPSTTSRAAVPEQLRRGTGHLARRLAQRLQPAPDAVQDVSPWSVSAEVRGRLDEPDLHLLGAGLLSTADVTLEIVRRGRRWYVNPAMDSIVADILATGGYGDAEVRSVSAVLQRLRPASTVVNIGANVGTTAIALAELEWRVVAVEPVPRALDLLRRNVAANGHEQSVEIVGAAVANESGTLEMVVGDNLSTSEVRAAHDPLDLATPGDVRIRVVSVPSAPLLDIVREAGLAVDDIAAVWSDTEGFEGAVIQSGRDLWKAGVPLWAEIRPSALLDHGRLTDFCHLAADHFRQFLAEEDVPDPGAELIAVDDLPWRPVGDLRDLVDDVGRDRWAFTNVLLRP